MHTQTLAAGCMLHTVRSYHAAVWQSLLPLILENEPIEPLTLKTGDEPLRSPLCGQLVCIPSRNPSAGLAFELSLYLCLLLVWRCLLCVSEALVRHVGLWWARLLTPAYRQRDQQSRPRLSRTAPHLSILCSPNLGRVSRHV